MPDSGDVSRVDSSPRTDSDSQVRVYGVSPGKGEQPLELVSGFLEATTSDEERFDTAKQYLSGKAASRWDPFASVTVLAEAPKMRVVGHQESDGITVELSGTQLATVDEHHAYEPQERPYRQSIHLGRDRSEWRIDQLPPGLVIGEADFQRIYRSVNTYFFAKLGPDAGASRFEDSVLVADPVYLRRRIAPVTATVKSLLDGPTSWLSPVVSSAFPRGTSLKDSGDLTLDDSGGLRIRLGARAGRVDTARCQRMAAQVLFTVQDQASARLSGVRLDRANGSELCTLTRETAMRYAPEAVDGRASHVYFVDGRHRMVWLSEHDSKPLPVPGPFGADGAQLGSVAVDRDERRAAAVSRDGRSLYVAELSEGAERGRVRLHSGAGGGPEDGLSAPSWDALGGLWVADRDPQGPRLLRLQDGEGTPQEVRIPELGKGRIEGLRVSADGTRIALLVKRDGHTRLLLGRVERGGSADEPLLSVLGLRRIAPKLVEVDAASWAGGSRLVVAGRESKGVQQLQYVETDGSPANVQQPPSPNRAESLASAEDPDKPLIAESTDGIVRLPRDGDWKTVAEQGTAPVYPG
ncbi:hypothetical protein E4099_07645 [Streptomyces palmae]|uniref:GerMN domain-containing protein n=2 Tax=Streptomyces palmae TaxID=1701085 RepID=A0A4Z0HCS0_9ACTN|nr:hypothetical protein E4099_07645 [Streptomyces palmae]